jgi:uncharacterized protein (DUF2267 family)
VDYNEFIEKVQEYAELSSRDEAIKSAEVTLRTLGERLSSPHRKHLATQLPRELKVQVQKRKSAEYFSLEEFYGRVSAHTQTTYHQAMKNARAVMCVVQEAVALGELDDIFSEIHDGWEELFKAKLPGPISSQTVDAHELFRK